tara:strand:- start:154 stop:480 length:327 start_codon:yes stop_codon:yes gene_type:complete
MDEVTIPEDGGSFKFLVIEYQDKKYIRWAEILPGIDVDHKNIGRDFIEELVEEGLPEELGSITGDRANINDKKIEVLGWGSRSYPMSDFDEVKQLIEGAFPEYSVVRN